MASFFSSNSLTYTIYEFPKKFSESDLTAAFGILKDKQSFRDLSKFFSITLTSKQKILFKYAATQADEVKYKKLLILKGGQFELFVHGIFRQLYRSNPKKAYINPEPILDQNNIDYLVILWDKMISECLHYILGQPINMNLTAYTFKDAALNKFDNRKQLATNMLLSLADKYSARSSLTIKDGDTNSIIVTSSLFASYSDKQTFIKQAENILNINKNIQLKIVHTKNDANEFPLIVYPNAYHQFADSIIRINIKKNEYKNAKTDLDFISTLESSYEFKQIKQRLITSKNLSTINFDIVDINEIENVISKFENKSFVDFTQLCVVLDLEQNISNVEIQPRSNFLFSELDIKHSKIFSLEVQAKMAILREMKKIYSALHSVNNMSDIRLARKFNEIHCDIIGEKYAFFERLDEKYPLDGTRGIVDGLAYSLRNAKNFDGDVHISFKIGANSF